MANNDHHISHLHGCFLEWMNLQEKDLAELLQSLTVSDKSESTLIQLTEKSLQHFQDYTEKRIQLARDDISPFFAPAWNSSLENSLLWLAGCRPSMFIRLIYAQCGSQVDAQFEQYLQGTSTSEKSSLGGDLSCEQFNKINDLHVKTVKDEDNLTTRFAGLQEDIADEPISILANNRQRHQLVSEPDEVVDRALAEHDKSMVRILEEADKLRVSTLKGLVRLLSPVQAVNYMAAAKKLHICLHEWGKQRDRMHGRIN